MKGIYLAAFKAEHENYEIVYQDINGKRDVAGDMMDVDLSPYDFIIASPPCNFYSRANYRRDISEYSQKTKHLLPSILKKLCKQDKPFIVENVCNSRIFSILVLFIKSAGTPIGPIFYYLVILNSVLIFDMAEKLSNMKIFKIALVLIDKGA